MTRMRTYAGSALAALCLIGVSACSSSDDGGSEAEAGTGSSSTAASSTRSGSVSQVDGRVKLELDWNKGREKTGFDNVSPALGSVTCEGTGPTLKADVAFPEGIQVQIDAATETVVVTTPEIQPVTNPIRAESVTWGMNGVEFDGTGDVELKFAGDDSSSPGNATFRFLVTC